MGKVTGSFEDSKSVVVSDGPSVVVIIPSVVSIISTSSLPSVTISVVSLTTVVSASGSATVVPSGLTVVMLTVDVSNNAVSVVAFVMDSDDIMVVVESATSLSVVLMTGGALELIDVSSAS